MHLTKLLRNRDTAISSSYSEILLKREWQGQAVKLSWTRKLLGNVREHALFDGGFLSLSIGQTSHVSKNFRHMH